MDGIILVYDITHEESFLNLQNWVTCIQVLQFTHYILPMFVNIVQSQKF